MAFEQRSEGRKGRAKQIPGERAEETERAKSVRKEWSWRFLRKSKEVSVPGSEQTRESDRGACWADCRETLASHWKTFNFYSE